MQIFVMITMLLFALLLYFIIIRPQRKRDERFALMIASVRPGSRVYAGGGIYGEVTEVGRGCFIMVTSPQKTVLELPADSIERVEGFDPDAERTRQRALRKTRRL